MLKKTRLVATVAVAGFIASGCIAHMAPAAAQTGPQRLILDCNPKRDAAIEKLITDANMIPSEQTQSTYCLGSIDTKALPDFKADSIKVVWLGNTNMNCGQLGCPVLFAREASDKSLKNVTPAGSDYVVLNGKDIAYQIDASKQDLVVGLPTMPECFADASVQCDADPKTGKPSKPEMFYSYLRYDVKKATFR